MGFLTQITAIAIGGFIAQWTAWKTRVPAIVFLLAFGFILGPVSGVVVPEELLGEFMRPAVSFAVAIILFEASLTLRFREIRDVAPTVTRIVLFGAPAGWFLLSCGAYFIAGLSWPVAITFGGILVVTGPTVIVPILKHAHIDQQTTSILKWEGVINDPLGVILAVLAYEYFHISTDTPLQGVLLYSEFVLIVAGVCLMGYLVGVLTAYILERGMLPEYLKAPFLVSGVLGLFTVSDLFLHESGLIAVTIYGMTLANKRVSSIEEIKRFKETITLLLVSGVFIILTADLDPSLLAELDMKGLLFIAAVIFVIRPVTIFLATLGNALDFKQKLLIGWIAPRGIVCAAIAGIMGPLLVEAGFEDGEKILPLAFATVMGTVVLHSLTIGPLARMLGLVSRQADGLIIVGASDWAIQLAEVLKAKNVPVLIAGTNWHSLKPARLADIPVYYGEFLSDETEYNLDLTSYGALLAATDNAAYNSFACNSLARELGRENVFQISYTRETGPERQKFAHTRHGRIFINSDWDFYDWWQMFRKGWRFRAVNVGPDVSEDEIMLRNQQRVKVGVISHDGMLTLCNPEYDPPAKENDTLLIFEKIEDKYEDR